MTSPMDDAFQRTTAAVERYEAPEPMIRATADSLAGREKVQRLCLEGAALGDAILTMAEMHGGPHGRGCVDCASVRNGLAVVAGILRAEVDEEFAEAFRER